MSTASNSPLSSSVSVDFRQALRRWQMRIEAGEQAQVLLEMQAQESALSNPVSNDAIASDYWLLRGAALGKLIRTEEALTCFEKASALNPSNQSALFNQAESLRFLGRKREAVSCLQRGAELFADNPAWLQRLWWGKRQLCDWQPVHLAQESVLTARELDAQVGLSMMRQAEDPNSTWIPDAFASLVTPLSEVELLRIAQRRAQVEERSLGPVERQGQAQWKNHQRLRVGWLSADFHEHATLHLLLEVLEKLPRSDLECWFYSFGPDFEDASRKRLRACGHFVDIAHLGSVQAAQRIIDDQIDVLIDLKGYTAFARPAILALKPAPIQVQWLGYPGSMGASWIDWIWADAVIIPQARVDTPAPGYTERVLYLPNGYQPNQSLRWLGSPPTRAQLGLPSVGPIWAHFNSPYKIDSAAWAIWMQALKRVPQAVLWLLADEADVMSNLRAAAQEAGIDPARLVFAPKLPPKAHLQRLQVADLALDPLSMGGHTTSSDALRAGVPVLTVLGNTLGRRVAASLLHTAGLSDAVLSTPDQYLQVLVMLGQEPARMRGLKMRAQAARFLSPLFDPQAFARDVAEALHAVAEHARQQTASNTNSSGKHLIDLRRIAPKKHSLAPAPLTAAQLKQDVHRAQAHIQNGQLPEAETLLLQLLRQAPYSANTCALLAYIRHRQDRHHESALLFAMALERLPQVNAQMLHNLASSLDSALHFADAELAYRQALKLEPDRYETLAQLGCMMRNLGRVDEALALHERMRELQPNDAQTLYTYGGTQYQAGLIEAAMHSMQKALDLSPDLHEARSNLGICHLLLGQFEAGWDAFEARWQSPQMKGSWAPIAAPAWQGEDLNDKAFLAWAEQGLGDNIQFVRYLGLLRLKYPRVRLAFWGPQTLLRLFEGFAQTHRIQLIAQEEARNPRQLSGMDYHAPLMGLPRLFGTRLDSIPGAVPAYLSLRPEWLQDWHARVQALELESNTENASPSMRMLNVGLVWSGQLEGIAVQKRNIDIRKLEPWLQVPGVRWFSLQVGAEQAAQVQGTAWEGRLIDWTADLKDFADTASLSRALDLVITVDTSTAHASAAAGSTVWMLSRFDGCWRWLQERSDSPWYPTMQVFRQPKPLHWEPVIAQVAHSLRERVWQLHSNSPLPSPSSAPLSSSVAAPLAIPSTALQQAIELVNQGRQHRAQGDYEAAYTCYDRAAQLAPNESAPWLVKGFALRQQMRLSEAEQCYQQALMRNAHDAQAHYNLAIVQLMQGRYAEGWSSYAWRKRLPGVRLPQNLGSAWSPQESKEHTVLVYQEQGLGDALQFARYLPWVAERSQQVLWAVNHPLLRLMRESWSHAPRIQVIDAEHMANHRRDSAVSVMDLPGLLGLSEGSENAQYLRCAPARVSHWDAWLSKQVGGSATRPIRIGLVWRGNPGRLRNDTRSIPASELLAWATSALPQPTTEPEATAREGREPSRQWVSLQIDHTEDDANLLQHWPALLRPGLSGLLVDMAETAALARNLDLLITVDTSIAHLGGALGLPTWVLLAHDSDWRWQCERSDSPWYPSVRLFRQRQAGQWTDVVQTVNEALRSL